MKDGAEKRYVEAFERLKLDQPKLLPKGSPVTQNNVAKEAGCDPSALKKSRFPSLIEQIQKFLATQATIPSTSIHQVRINARKKNRELKDRLIATTQQRDQLASMLSEAESTILELYERLEELKRKVPDSNVVKLITNKNNDQ